MIKAVIFDLDGTLIDSTEAIVGSFFHTFDTLGAPRPTRQAIIDSIGHPLAEQLGHLTTLPVEACVRAYREHYAVTACAQTFLIPGAEAALRAFHAAGLRLGFASSKNRAMAEYLLEHLGVREFFEVCIGPDEVTQPKPHPEAVLKAAAGLGAAPEETFFVGDMHFDVLAGQAAGARVLAVATGYLSHEALEVLAPEAVFHDLTAMRHYVLREVARSTAGV